MKLNKNNNHIQSAVQLQLNSTSTKSFRLKKLLNNSKTKESLQTTSKLRKIKQSFQNSFEESLPHIQETKQKKKNFQKKLKEPRNLNIKIVLASQGLISNKQNSPRPVFLKSIYKSNSNKYLWSKSKYVSTSNNQEKIQRIKSQNSIDFHISKANLTGKLKKSSSKVKILVRNPFQRKIKKEKQVLSQGLIQSQILTKNESKMSQNEKAQIQDLLFNLK